MCVCGQMSDASCSDMRSWGIHFNKDFDMYVERVCLPYPSLQTTAQYKSEVYYVFNFQAFLYFN